MKIQFFLRLFFSLSGRRKLSKWKFIAFFLQFYESLLVIRHDVQQVFYASREFPSSASKAETKIHPTSDVSYRSCFIEKTQCHARKERWKIRLNLMSFINVHKSPTPTSMLCLTSNKCWRFLFLSGVVYTQKKQSEGKYLMMETFLESFWVHSTVWEEVVKHHKWSSSECQPNWGLFASFVVDDKLLFWKSESCNFINEHPLKKNLSPGETDERAAWINH